MMQVFDIEQGEAEWFEARLGIPTASKFATVMAKGEGKTRSEYMRRLAGEILTGEPSETFANAHMERGKVMEDDARETYAFVEMAEIKRVGFIRNGNKGASPDSLVGTNGGLEIKTAMPHIQIDRLERDRLPPEHKAQVQGNLWLSEREWWDFVSYWPRLPMLTVRVYRDEDYIREMAGEIDRFNAELADLVERIRHYGMKEAA
ncbi:YqaJ viral recombinase family protein [Rhizobium sp. ARZ01]|uniref:lambda exonuclease family protein n=1 Tax=Rhizobium sp. ARZ01 TaxID=2769313 RepID=UPI00177DA732|nr:lambda exonuclease family protein [Rhizobium sp. ARZ01]MBD9372806.1 YqaJ viral recombinase family protein [Rhizobium sp. ARZ01]